MTIQPSGNDAGTDLDHVADKAERAVGALTRKFFHNSQKWGRQVWEALFSVGRKTAYVVGGLILYSALVTIWMVWDDPVLATVIQVLPLGAILFLLGQVVGRLSLILGWWSRLATALMLFSVVILGVASQMSHMAGKGPVDPAVFYGRIIEFVDIRRTPLVVTNTETVTVEKIVEVPKIEYVDRRVEVPVKHAGVMKATVCADESWTRCVTLVEGHLKWGTFLIDFTPKLANAEKGWAVVSMMSENSEQEAWRVEEGFRKLEPFEQKYRWIRLKPYP